MGMPSHHSPGHLNYHSIPSNRPVYPHCRLTTAVSLQQRLPFTEFTKKEFGVAIKVISVLECVPDEFSNFTWSKMRQDMFEGIYQKIKDLAPASEATLHAGVVG